MPFATRRRTSSTPTCAQRYALHRWDMWNFSEDKPCINDHLKPFATWKITILFKVNHRIKLSSRSKWWQHHSELLNSQMAKALILHSFSYLNLGKPTVATCGCQNQIIWDFWAMLMLRCFSDFSVDLSEMLLFFGHGQLDDGPWGWLGLRI